MNRKLPEHMNESTATNKKEINRTRRFCKFQSDWLKLQEFQSWLRNIQDDEMSAYCSVCKLNFSIKFEGVAMVKKHATSKKHLQNVNAITVSARLSTFFPTRNTIDEDEAITSEIALAYHGVMHNHSYMSQDCGIKLVKKLFSDSKKSQRIHCGRTKAEAIVKNVLAPYSVENVLFDVGNGPISIATDASNKGNKKLFPVAIRYFSIKKGPTTFLIDFYEDNDETSEAIAAKLIESLEKSGMARNKLVAYGADNASVNYGKFKSVFQHLKRILKLPNLIAGHCHAHILHNTGKQALKTISFNVESFVIEVFSEFSSSAKKLAELKDFFNFMETDYVQLLGHSRIRFLTLFPAVDRILQSWPVLKSYFISKGEENVSKLIWKFVSCDQDSDVQKDENNLSEAYLYFIHNIMNILSSNIKHLESDYIQPTEVYDIFYKIKLEIENRLEKNFFGFKANQILLQVDRNKKEYFTKEAVSVYKKILCYLNKWFDYSADAFFYKCKQFNLENELIYDEVIEVAQNLEIPIDKDALFSEICFLNSILPKLNNMTEQNSSITSENPHKVVQKWFKFFDSGESPNLFLIVQYIFIVPPSNCYVERVFSVMKNKWHDTRSRMLVPLIKAELLVHFNFKLNCSEFLEFITCNKELIKAAKSDKKYEFKTKTKTI